MTDPCNDLIINQKRKVSLSPRQALDWLSRRPFLYKTNLDSGEQPLDSARGDLSSFLRRTLYSALAVITTFSFLQKMS